MKLGKWVLIVCSLLLLVIPNQQTASSAPVYYANVDFSNIQFHPLLKSKIGIAGALQTSLVNDSLPYMDAIRPAFYNGEIRFPNTDWPYLTPYPIEVLSDGTIQVQDNTLLKNFHQGLNARNIQIIHQIIGAPKQWHPYDLAQKAGAKFPYPTDLDKSAEAMKLWSQQYNSYPVTWTMWNEPEHNLTGERTDESAQKMLNIYDAYYEQMKPVNDKASFGMADLTPWGAQLLPELGGKSYIQTVLDKYFTLRTAKPNVQLDYLTMNNYGPRIWNDNLLGNARNALGTQANKTPLMLLQYGPYNPGAQWDANSGLTSEAVKSLIDLDKFLKISDLQAVGFAGWIGHILRWQGSNVLELPLYNMLKLYAQMPVWRVSSSGNLPSGVATFASADENRASVMMWNDSTTPYTIDLNLSGLPSGILSKPAPKLSLYKIDANNGSPLENGTAAFASIEEQTISSSSLTKTVTISGPGIAYLQIDNGTGDTVLDRGGLADSSFLKKYFYSDRLKDANDNTYVRESYCSYDAVRATAYAGVNGSLGRAVCGVEYEGLPNKLKVNVLTDKFSSTMPSTDSMFGIRVDYIENGAAVKSVLWHGDVFDSARTKNLPWGKGGTTADDEIIKPQMNKGSTGNRQFELNLEQNAPSDWGSNGSRAIISFWMESTGEGSQARFMLSSNGASK
jgi:hypothetical protein